MAAEHCAAGRYGEALALVDQHRVAADDPSLMFARGSALFDWARYWEARPWLIKAATSGIGDGTLYLRTGWSCLWTTGARSAEDWMRKAAHAGPEDWLGHFGLGSSLRGQGKTDEAVASFERALELSPDNLHCLANLCDCRLSQNRPVDAESYVRRAVRIDDQFGQGWTSLGVALAAQDRLAEAIAAFEHAERIASGGRGDVDQHLNLANCLRETDRLAEALALYERNLPTRPSAVAQCHYAHALLTAGRLPEGWVHYEFRWFQQPLLSMRPSFGAPVWEGQDIRGKTVLLRAEQGIGDVIQFIRYAPHVKALGATVLLELRKGIRELAGGFPGVDELVDPNRPLPRFDYYIHLMSLPRVFGTDLARIPAEVPYLHTEPGRIAHWQPRMGSQRAFKVGIVWGGDPAHLRDRFRSIRLAALAPLGRVEGVQFFSMQKGVQAAQLDSWRAAMPLVDFGPDLRDFADTAAVISELDLVISVDTSVAHLAGALGKPVWVMVPTPPEWRWLEHREDSPWYPTMRLFRQTHQGEWSDVVERLKDALDAAARNHRAIAAATPTRQGAERVAAPLRPVTEFGQWRTPGLSAVAETRVGIVQYWPDQPLIGRSIELYGEYLQRQFELLARIIAPGSTVLEVGAGVGIHTLFLASRIGPEGHLLLYEDDALRRQALQHNLRSNGFGNFTLMTRRLGTGDDVDTIDELRLERLQWIKASEDGCARAILEPAADTLWRLRPGLFLAMRDDAELTDIAARVRDFGYRCFRVETPLFNPDNFNRRESDAFAGRTALVLLAIPEEATLDLAMDGCVALN